ncbi:MAG TPA: hypothetical protein VET88_02485 [Gammaproteobacteria bacterium]|nr:hypothetical protein [Gammaproteobacteria bacterium]
MTLTINPASEAHIGYRWLLGLSVMLFSIIVLAENTDRLDITPAYNDDRLSDGIYNSVTGWRTPDGDENEWRPEKQAQESRIQFGYDSAFEEMRARDIDLSQDTGSGIRDNPQNTQFKFGF